MQELLRREPHALKQVHDRKGGVHLYTALSLRGDVHRYARSTTSFLDFV